MQASLEALARQESELIAALPATGSGEGRPARMDPASMSKRWANVFADYLALLDDPAQGPEALRRATFLAWYPYNEPSFLTGIDPFEAPAVRLVLQRVEEQFAAAVCDPELRAMLWGYGPGLPFDQYPELTILNEYLGSISGPYSPDRSLGPMTGRGTMGDYWASRLDAA